MTGDVPAHTPAALEGVRVLDLSGIAGQYAGKLLADLGADVLCVEPPAGSPARERPPFAFEAEHGDRSIPFWYWNTSKRSLCLDVSRTDGYALLLRLLPRYDVLMHAYPADQAAWLGLDRAALAARHPSIITCAITAYGDSGPHAGWQADDMTVAAMSGLMTLAGYPDRAPAMPPGEQAMVCGSIQAAQGILIALFGRDASGEGQHVEVSQQEAMAITQETAMQFWDMRQELRRRRGEERPVPGSGTYACADGYVFCMLGAGARGGQGLTALVAWMAEEGMAGELTEPEWQGAVASMNVRGLTALAGEPEKLQALMQRARRVEDLVGDFFKTKTKHELYTEGQRRRLMFGPVNSPRDIRENEHLAARDWWQEVEHPELGRAITYPGPPFRHAETPWRIRGRAPELGEHTRAVLEDELGLTPAETEALAGAGVI
jgi:benzylsuccinate CoA-transferase BbsE subunit